MDDNNSPKLENQINTPPSKEELNEKTYDDNDSAPIIENFYNNNPRPIDINYMNKPSKYYELNNIQPEYLNYPLPGSSQPINQAYPGQAAFYPPQGNYFYNNVIQNNDGKQIATPENKLAEKYKILMCLSILLIIFFIVDFVLQICCRLNLFMLIDDFAILVIAIIFLIFSCKRKSFNLMIGYANIFVWFVGFALRGIGMIQFRDSNLSMLNFFLNVVRTFILFFCIPLTFRQ